LPLRLFGNLFSIVASDSRPKKIGRHQKMSGKTKTMKTIALKNGQVIFVEQIAFIHVQPSASDGVKTPEIHVHFSATFSLPKSSRSMRTVIGEDGAQDFIDQLEKNGVDCTHIRRCLA
jgi:hypothetical protein